MFTNDFRKNGRKIIIDIEYKNVFVLGIKSRVSHMLGSALPPSYILSPQKMSLQ
jgi:hypothetical protein